MNDVYPVQFSVDYPDRDLNRVSTGFRIFTVIPLAGVLGTIGGYSARWGTSTTATSEVALGGTGLLFIPPLLMIVFRQKYPRWWFDWNLQLLRFANRVGVYLAVMDDRYPSTDETESVTVWLPIVKWLLAIPHSIVLFFLYVGLVLAVIGAWFAILFTGRYPRAIFD